MPEDEVLEKILFDSNGLTSHQIVRFARKFCMKTQNATTMMFER